MTDYVTIGMFSQLSGHAEAAIRSKILLGFWPENWVWRIAPDRKTLISRQGYEGWIEDPRSSSPEPCFPPRDAKTLQKHALRLRSPQWRDGRAIADTYAECARISRDAGIEYEVDHIVPLRGRKVSGLHVHNNLQILLALDNMRKGNRWADG